MEPTTDLRPAPPCEPRAPIEDLASPWWPSPFGPEDEIGMLNHITPEKRAAALELVGEGRLYDLGHVLDDAVPVFPGRYFNQTLVTTAHHANADGPQKGLGGNEVNWITEVVTGTMQLGTHIDALSHLQVADRAYNGVTVSALAGASGVSRLGAETIPQIVTRGLLVDVAAARGVDHLEIGDVITGGDIERALGDLRPEPGDAVLFHTGWSTHFGDPPTYLAGQPGPGLDVARWIMESGVALTGSDTWSYGAVPGENEHCPFEVPQMLNVRHGVFIVENLATAELAAAGVREFALVLTHPKLRGATGAWTSPIALV
jgi:kynurenine formamidase